MTQPAPPPDPCAATAADTLRRLAVDPASGLDHDEVVRRRQRYGENRLSRQAGRTVLGILVDQFRSVIVLLLAAAAALSVQLGDVTDAFAILVVLIVNAAIGFVSELRATRSMEALRRIAEHRTRVRRGGRGVIVPARVLVPGDIVVLEAGDMVTADLRLIGTADLQIAEAALTGESVPVAKSDAALPADTPLPDRTNMAFRGTAVTRGSGEGVVVATGAATQVGHVAALAGTAEAALTPLEQRLDRLGRRLVWLTLALSAAVTGAGVVHGRGLGEMVQTGVALAVAAVPEGLPVVATLCLARGMWRMAARNALISRLSAVETLGAVTVILTDKTGTLTENRMSVERLLLDGAEVAPDNPDPRAGRALRVGALCTNATADGTGDPMEVALLRAARAAGLDRAALLRDAPELAEHAFDPDLMMMATVHRAGDGAFAAVKGAPEAVIGRATAVAAAQGPRPLDAAGRKAWTERAAEAASRGFRVLALAERTLPQDIDFEYESLTLLGLACLLDPVRGDVPSAIADARAAGVRVVMLTGDHADTASEIARQAGIGGESVSVIEERALAGLSDDPPDPTFSQRVANADVFARVSPETKLRLVAFFQRRGAVVAMTGDGVNDAPALRKADIGIAMGQRGTDVAREAAHMVLKDDAFPTIIAAMREGRIIFDNIRRFVVYLMSCNVSEVLVVGLAIVVGLPSPLLPLQILYLNLVTDIFPAFALGLGQGEASVLRRPPRDPREPIMDAARWRLMGWLGGFITLATLGAYGLALGDAAIPEGGAVTVAFVTLALAQMWTVFNLRDPGSGIFVNDISRNPLVWAALALCLGLLAAAIWMPQLAAVLGLTWPGWPGLGIAAAASFVPPVLGQGLLELRMKALTKDTEMQSKSI